MRVLVCGGRHFRPLETVYRALDKLHAEHPIDLVIHGACPTGADRWASYWAQERGVREDPYPGHWTRYGRAAGPIRNQQMLDEARPEGIVAFPGGRGTADMVRRAEAAGLKVWFPYGRPK